MIEPMLAQTGTKGYLDKADWLFEDKLDGVRCLAVLNPHLSSTKLQSRSGHDITAKFPEVAELHRQVSTPCILDGELVGVNFNAIQHRIHQEKSFAIRIAQSQYPCRYGVFDILSLDYDAITEKPLTERKEILVRTISQSDIASPISWTTEGRKLFEHSQELNLEGVMAKYAYSPYLLGKRSPYWLKIKNFKEAEYFIAGLTEGENDRASTFGSLILAKRVDGKLEYMGNVGSGFNHEQLRMMLYLAEFMKAECPFEVRPNTDRPVKFWVRPELKAEVRFLELSPNGLLRFPTFRRLVK